MVHVDRVFNSLFLPPKSTMQIAIITLPTRCSTGYEPGCLFSCLCLLSRSSGYLLVLWAQFRCCTCGAVLRGSKYKNLPCLWQKLFYLPVRSPGFRPGARQGAKGSPTCGRHTGSKHDTSLPVVKAHTNLSGRLWI